MNGHRQAVSGHARKRDTSYSPQVKYSRLNSGVKYGLKTRKRHTTFLGIRSLHIVVLWATHFNLVSFLRTWIPYHVGRRSMWRLQYCSGAQGIQVYDPPAHKKPFRVVRSRSIASTHTSYSISRFLVFFELVSQLVRTIPRTHELQRPVVLYTRVCAIGQGSINN